MKTAFRKPRHWREKLAALFYGSAFIRWSERAYRAMFSGCFGSYLTQYTARQRTFAASAVGGAVNRRTAPEWRESFLGRLRRAAIVSYERSGILAALTRMGRWLLGSYLKMYGFFCMYFGFSVLLVNLVKRFALHRTGIGSGGLFIGVLLLVASLPMLVSGKTLIRALDESVCLSLLLYRILGVSRVDMLALDEKTRVGARRYLGASLIGALLGLVTYVIAPVYVLFFLFACLAASLVYRNPAIGVLATIAAIPFLSFLPSASLLLALMVLYAVLCAAIKVFLGRLVLTFEISDAFVFLFLLLYCLGGLASVGGAASFREAMLYVCYLFMYFLVVSLVRSREWLTRCTAALVFSGAGASLYGLLQLVTGQMEHDTLDQTMFSDISGRMTSVFDNANMFGVFLIMVIPFALGYVFAARRPLAKLAALAACGLMGVCLLLTWSRGAWLGLFVALVVFALLEGPYLIPVIAPVLLLGVTLLWNRLAGNGFVNKLLARLGSILSMSDSSSVYRLGIWRGALRILKEYWFCGIGVGSEAFRMVYIRHAESGIETAVHSHNLLLQVMIETGVIGAVILLAALFLCVKSGLETIRFSGADTAYEKAMTVAAISGLFAAFMQSLTDHIWYNFRIFFVFWTVVALLSAAARIGRRSESVSDEF